MTHDRYEEGGSVAGQCNYRYTITANGQPVGTTVMAYDDYCAS